MAQDARPIEPRTIEVVVRQQLARGEAPVAGLAVALGWSRDLSVWPPRSEPRLRITLDERGHHETRLVLPRDEPEAFVWAQIVEPGYQRHARAQRVSLADASAQLVLPARRGGTLRGVVRGVSVMRRAKLRLVPADGPPSELLASTADANGRFELHFTARGRYHLMASSLMTSSGSQGLALLHDVALDPFHAGDPGASAEVELELAPGLELSGRIVDPDGEPVYPFSVRALPERFALAATDEMREREWSSGVLGERADTDADGRFTLHGLPPGRYALAGNVAGRIDVLGPDLHPAGERHARVEARVHRVRLTVRASSGELLDLGALLPESRNEPGDPLLFLGLAGSPHRPRFIQRHAAFLVAEEGDEVRYAFASARDPLVEGRTRVPASPWLVDAELRLAPPVEPAVLALQLSGGEGLGYMDLWLSLLSESGVDLCGAFQLPGHRSELRVPPGRYRVKVEPMVTAMCGNAPLDDFLPPLAPAAAEVELVAGERAAVELALLPNARLAVELALPRVGSVEEIEAALHTDDYREPLRRVLHGARVELAPLSGDLPSTPVFRVELREHDIDEIRAPWVAPGRESVSLSGLAPGAYRLTATLHDGRRIERDVELVGERTTTVTLVPE